MRIYFLLFLTLLTSICFGQNYGFINYSQADGLAQSQVRSMHLDTRGRLWIGTVGGLSSFDGEKFINHSKFTGMYDDHANVIKELEDGRIAIGSIGAISIISNSGYENVIFKDGFENSL